MSSKDKPNGWPFSLDPQIADVQEDSVKWFSNLKHQAVNIDAVARQYPDVKDLGQTVEDPSSGQTRYTDQGRGIM